jgi:hypothetical protein
MFFSLAWCLKRAMTWLASPTRSISSIFNFPDSILENLIHHWWFPSI